MPPQEGEDGVSMLSSCSPCQARDGRRVRISAIVLLASVAMTGSATAQIFEAVGSRALGMGGAFVAVANDSSATWWNPGALPEGPFVDSAASGAITESSEHPPARRDRVGAFSITSTPAGFSYYRLRITEIQDSDPIGQEGVGREDELGSVPVRSFSASQFGVTVVQTLLPGVHAGTTLKYVRGTVRSSIEDSGLSTSDLLDRGEDLEGGDADNEFDMDIGVLAVAGAVRLGGVVRNVLEAEFRSSDSEGAPTMRLPRQVRMGVAFDGTAIEFAPLVVALDADLQRYETVSGDRRVVALGVEYWLFGKRVGLRAGGRFNTVGPSDRAATAGVSVALRSGFYLDGHIVRGGTADDRGWGTAFRVSF